MTFAGEPAASDALGIDDVTTEPAPMIESAPIVTLGMTNTRHGSQTRSSMQTGPKATGAPLKKLDHDPWVKINVWPPIPARLPIRTPRPGSIQQNGNTRAWSPSVSSHVSWSGSPATIESRAIEASAPKVSRRVVIVTRDSMLARAARWTRCPRTRDSGAMRAPSSRVR